LKRETNDGLNGGSVFAGMLLGLVVGGVVTLFTAPKSGQAFRRQFSSSVNETGQNLRAGIEAIVPTDPVAESMAEGKAAARRRLGELGHN
jgi:gas vesicle protein